MKEGELLLGIDADAFLWTMWRKISNLPPVKKIGNFYHLQPEDVKSYDLFGTVIKKYKKEDSVLLPCVAEIEQYSQKKGIKVDVASLFGLSVVAFPQVHIDELVEFINENCPNIM